MKQNKELFSKYEGGNRFKKLFVDFTLLVRNILDIVRVSPLTIVSILCLFFFVWASDQGQDLILIINDYSFGPFFMYVVVIILALMNWHFPKFFYNFQWEGKSLKALFTLPFNYSPDDRADNPAKIDMPRLLGMTTILIPAIGMLKVLDVFGVGFWADGVPAVIWLVIAIVLAQICFAKKVFVAIYRRWTKLFWGLCILLALVPVFLWPMNHSMPQDIILLFWGLLSYALLFAFISSNRLEVAKTIRILNDKHITALVWLTTVPPVLLFLFYFFCNMVYWRGFDLRFLPLTVALSGIISYYVLFTILTVLGKIHTINFSLLLVLAMTLVTFSFCNYFHNVDLADAKEGDHLEERTLDTYIRQWLDARIGAGKDTTYPIYLVNTYGGGIRAAAWTSFCINKLDSLQYQLTKETFQDHVLAYSGASGGTIGAAIMCATRAKYDNPIKNEAFTKFYSYDFLTPVLAGLIGNDIWYSGLYVASGRDRSKVQEHLWEYFFEEEFGFPGFGAYTGDIWKKGGTNVPLLFANTTDVQYGRKGIYAPVILDSADFPGSTIVSRQIGKGKVIKLSTAAFLSARFPFVSPAGRLNDDHHFLDGGIVENSGAETSLQLYNVLQRIINSSPKYQRLFSVTVVSLKNTYLPEEKNERKKAKNLSQFFAPLSAAINVGVGANTRKADDINRQVFCKNDKDLLVAGYHQLQPSVARINGKKRVVSFGIAPGAAVIPLPLGWSISDLALERMRSSADKLSQKGGKLYEVLHPRPCN
jgi:hypothetical protein